MLDYLCYYCSLTYVNKYIAEIIGFLIYVLVLCCVVHFIARINKIYIDEYNTCIFIMELQNLQKS